MLAVLLAFVLQGTIPAFESAPGCSVSTAPEDHIFYLACFDSSTGVRLSILPTEHRTPGERFLWVVEVYGPHRVYVRAYDEADNESCNSRTVPVDGGPQPVVGVDPRGGAPETLLYAVNGARVRSGQRLRPGIYFLRLRWPGGKLEPGGRLVIVR